MRISEKMCSKCNQIKLIDEFYKASGRNNYKRMSWCKECTKNKSKSLNKNSSYYKDWRSEMRQEIENKTERGMLFLQQKLFHSAKNRAKSYNIEFTISKDDIIIPDICPILGIELISSTGHISMNSPTLDKIDPLKGYIPGNIQVISNRANLLKSNFTIDEVKLLLKWMEQHP